jgi:HEAT repeat protein/CheY-like chemotaxis protein
MVTHIRRLLAATGAMVALCLASSMVQAAAAKPAASAPAASAPTTAPERPSLAPEKTHDQKLADMWENFIHYVRIAQGEAAISFGKALLASGAKATEIYDLSVETPGSLATLSRGRQLEGMKDIVDQILKVIEDGYKTERSDPEQIKQAIELLGGTQRAYLRGRDRLIVSGEYAVPQLLRKLEEPEISNALREKIIVVLPQLGKGAVLPLASALLTKDPMLLQIIANTLGRIEYSQALPALKELYDRTDLQPETRRTLRAALVSCAGGDTQVLEKPVAQLYYDLALKFYYRAESLVPDERDPTANFWYWDNDLAGLTFKPVPRQIYCDVYGMAMGRRTLQHDPKFYPAVSLWLAADVKRESDLPKGMTDPTRTPEEPPAQFYVLSAGAKYQQEMLARALNDQDWPVAIASIEALGRTAGAETLVEPVAGGAQPLVQALTSPNRLVRYWAGLSLASALPKKRFMGCELVVPILSSATHASGKKTAIVVAAAQERRNTLKDALRGAGYEVADSNDPGKALQGAREAGGVDVAVLDNDPDAMVGKRLIRGDALLPGLPIVIAAQTERFQAEAKSDPRIRLVSSTATAAELAKAVADVVQTSAGAPLGPEEAMQWAVRSALALRNLGLTGNTVLEISRARPSLIEALGDPRPDVKVSSAAALATMSAPQAQRAIAKLALDSTVDEKVRLAVFGALGESARRYGNALTDEQSAAIVTLVSKGTGDLRAAAAEILGALSLPSFMIKDLILSDPAAK